MSTTHKTVRQWLETLPREIAEKAIRNMESHKPYTGEMNDVSLEEALLGAFHWQQPMEGHAYWEEISREFATGTEETKPPVDAAIVTLQMHLDTLNNNEPIWRAEGNIEQADLSLRNAQETRNALEILRK